MYLSAGAVVLVFKEWSIQAEPSLPILTQPRQTSPYLIPPNLNQANLIQPCPNRNPFNLLKAFRRQAHTEGQTHSLSCLSQLHVNFGWKPGGGRPNTLG